MITSSSWKDKVRSILPWNIYWIIKRLREECLVWWSGDNLTQLARIYKTDKWGFHFYTPHYQQWFAPLRNKPIRLLEIGVGGYDKPLLGGNSLRMWKSYFQKGTIAGIDLCDKSALREHRINIYQGDQSDEAFLQEISKIEGPFDIIIDDGSHMQSHILTSFKTLFPLMSPGGIYVIEDTQTSYRSKFEGSTGERETVHSAMNYFIGRVHEVNQQDWIKEELIHPIIETDIESIAFYHNMIFVVKR